MILTPKAKEYGKRMRVESVMYINKYTKIFNPEDEHYQKDIAMIFNDARDLYLIGSLMIKGDFHSAMEIADRMDTVVRDEIPKSVYNYLEKFTRE
jgi:hypothetical protein